MTETILGMALLFGLLLLFLAMGMPVAFAIGIPSLIVLVFVQDISPVQAVFATVGQVNNWVWITMPLFIFFGSLLSETGVVQKLIDFGESFIGHITGSLSHITVLAHTMMAGMSGSITADAAAIGSAMAPAMKRAGYPPGYVAAIIGIAAIIGPTIPPSIPLIMIGVLGEISILRLWLGGAIPGLLIAVVLLVVGYVQCRGKDYPRSKPATWKWRRQTFFSSIPALLIPLLILGGMRLGIFTVVEGADVAIFYTMIIAAVFYSWRNIKNLPGTAMSAVGISAKILLLIVMAAPFTFSVATLGGGKLLTDFLLTLTTNPVLFMLVIVVVFLFLGCFIETIPLVLIFFPVLIPAVNAYGIDLVQFGVLFMLTTMTGVLTPPVGAIMYLSTGIVGTDIVQYTRHGLPFLAGLIVVIILIALFPSVVTWFPNLIMGS